MSLAIVLSGPKPKNGRRVFDSFVDANRACFWNRELVAAMDMITYMGFMRPGTLFVNAPSHHLQAVRSAWSRRVLKPASGYQILSVGEFGAIQTIQQMHFVPLGDVLCDAIAHLNRMGQSATLSSIRNHVARNCPHVAPPTLEMVHQTLSSLTITGLVYQMGEHFFVSVPATQPVDDHKVSIECQTGESIIDASAEKPEKKRLGLLARLFSKKDSQVKVQPQPLTFTSQVPNMDWVCGTRVIPMIQKAAPIPTQSYNTYTDGHVASAYTASIDRRVRRHRRAERGYSREMSSSSECLNYGPIDPPECLPGHHEIVDDIYKRKRRRVKRKEMAVSTSTPVKGSDSAYSPSPVDETENEEPLGSWSEPEEHHPEDHTYVNLNIHGYDSTQFEEFTLTTVPSPPPPRKPMAVHLISNL